MLINLVLVLAILRVQRLGINSTEINATYPRTASAERGTNGGVGLEIVKSKSRAQSYEHQLETRAKQIQMEADKCGNKGAGKGQGNRVAELRSQEKIQAHTD